MTVNNVSTLAGRLRQARKAAKLTQEQLAAKIGVSQGIISQIEVGTNKQTVYIAQLAEACGVDAGWLATGKSVKQVTPSHSQVANDSCSLPVNLDKIKKWSEIKEGAMNGGRFLYIIESDIMSGQSGVYIPAGATVTIDQTKPHAPGCIMLADIDGAPWIGALSVIGTRHFLRPSNPQYPAIETTPESLIGVVVSYSVSLP